MVYDSTVLVRGACTLEEGKEIGDITADSRPVAPY